MTRSTLVRRALAYYWRTNLAVVLGVATAVTVLSGALLVGDSVRGSLRDLVLQRLGRADYVLASSTFFREQLAADLQADARFGSVFRDVCPMVAVQGLVTDQANGHRSLGVQVYGVDDRFWQFHGLPSAFRGGGADTRDVLISAALARDLAAETGHTILIRVQRPSDIPLDSLHGNKDDLGRTLRLTLQATLSAAALGDFSLQPQQGEVRAAFVPLARLQQELALEHRVNAMLLSSAAHSVNHDASLALPAGTTLESLVRQRIALEDLGLRLRPLDGQRGLSLEANGTLVDTPRAAAATTAAAALSMSITPVFTYLVDDIRLGAGKPDARTIPYSLVTAIDLQRIAPGFEARDLTSSPILLNEWAARDLHATPGDDVTLNYRVWEDPGVLTAKSATFQLAGIVPIAGAAADRDLVPDFPGVTGSATLRDWAPPFPIDLRRIRPADEDYWRTYRATPKAFIPLSAGQSLWQSKHGALTSIRIEPPVGAPLETARPQYSEKLLAALDPFAIGFSVHNVRADGLAASRGATDFGEYFTYFSFFLVASAVLLAVLFFKLGVEMRGREVGLLRAIGFTPARVRRLFVAEALVLSMVGSLIGLFGAAGYGYLMMAGLRTWWVGAVGTTALTLHVSPFSMAAGGIGGVLASVASIWWALRALKQVSERSLLAGRLTNESSSPFVLSGIGPTLGLRRQRAAAIGLLVAGLLLMLGGFAGWIGQTGAFFGAGATLLGACLAAFAAVLRRPSTGSFRHQRWPLARLGFRNAAYRPGRSVLSVAVMASATFLLISVGAFRQDTGQGPADRQSGTGGYALIVNTMLPIVHDPDTPDGRDLLGLGDHPDVAVTPFRVRPGDDASCLNLYEPQQPRIIAAGAPFVAAGRFSFQSSLASSAEERANPWRLLERPLGGNVIPVVADANSMTYVLHKSLGDEIVLTQSGAPVRLRLVGALADSIFQSELVMSDANFRALFPDRPGFQLLLVDAGRQSISDTASALEDRLSDFGADAVPASQRLAEFHQVENTYLATFQTLGGLGLLLGTIGLAAVLLRNVLERRRELALLGAVGYRRADIFTIIIAENTLLLVAGLVAGTSCALIAIAPAVIERGGRLPVGAGAWLLLFGVLTAGLLSSFIATRVTLRTRLLSALKAE